MGANQYPQPDLSANARMKHFEEQVGETLTNQNVEYYLLGFTEVDGVFSDAAGTTENLAAVLTARTRTGDRDIINSAGYILGAVARIEELQKGQQQ